MGSSQHPTTATTGGTNQEGAGGWGVQGCQYVMGTVLQDGGLLIRSGGMGYLFQSEATEKKISSREEHQDDGQRAIGHTGTHKNTTSPHQLYVFFP